MAEPLPDLRAWVVYEHGGGRYVTHEQRDHWKEPVRVVALDDLLKMLRQPSDALVLAVVRSSFDQHINGPNTIQRSTAERDLRTVADEIERAASDEQGRAD